MVIIFNEDSEKYQSVKEVPIKTKSPLAKWLVDKKIVKHGAHGEMFWVFIIFIIFVISGIIFSFAVGNNKVLDLQEGQSEYLE